MSDYIYFGELSMSYDDYFMKLALGVSSKSHDPVTKHGCVLVFNKRVISRGFNGFPSGLDDSILPTTRPDKYKMMVHAEMNAVVNLVLLGLSVCWPEVTAYVTGYLCSACRNFMYQLGIREYVVLDRVGTELERDRVCNTCGEEYIVFCNCFKFSDGTIVPRVRVISGLVG